MSLVKTAAKFQGIITKDKHQEVYKLCSVSIQDETITLSILESDFQSAQQN